MELRSKRGSIGCLTRAEVIQLIGKAMARDPARRRGTGGLRHFITIEEGVTLP